MRTLVVHSLYFYKKFLSPVFESLFGKACIYSPTCSEYAIQVIHKHGVAKGGTMAIARFASCNSFTLKKSHSNI